MNYIINPNNYKKININSKEAKQLLTKYIKKYYGGMQNEGSFEHLVKPYHNLENYLDWEKDTIKQLKQIYLTNFRNSTRLIREPYYNINKQILRFMIQFSIDKLDGKITIPAGQIFIRTVNKSRPFPNKYVTFMNCNSRGNYKISGSNVDSVLPVKTKQELKFVDLTRLCFLVGTTLKAGREQNRGLFSSCCKTRDMVEVCRELSIDGIINFDIADHVTQNDFVDSHTLKQTLPKKYFDVVKKDIIDYRAITSVVNMTVDDEGNITHKDLVILYPEFILIDYDKK